MLINEDKMCHHMHSKEKNKKIRNVYVSSIGFWSEMTTEPSKPWCQSKQSWLRNIINIWWMHGVLLRRNQTWYYFMEDDAMDQCIQLQYCYYCYFEPKGLSQINKKETHVINHMNNHAELIDQPNVGHVTFWRVGKPVII